MRNIGLITRAGPGQELQAHECACPEIQCISIAQLNWAVAGFPPDLPLPKSSTLEPVFHLADGFSVSPSKWEDFVREH